MSWPFNLPLDHPCMDNEIADFFDLANHLERDDRDVRSYESFRYAPYWFVEDPSADWWNPAWGSQMQLQTAQQYGQPHGRQQQDIQGAMPAPVRGEGLPLAGPAAQGSAGFGSVDHGLVAQDFDHRSLPATGPAAPGHNALDLAAPGPGRRRAAPGPGPGALDLAAPRPGRRHRAVPDPAPSGAADSDPIGPGTDPRTARRSRIAPNRDASEAAGSDPIGPGTDPRTAHRRPDPADSGLAATEAPLDTARRERAAHRALAPRPIAPCPAAATSDPAASSPPAQLQYSDAQSTPGSATSLVSSTPVLPSSSQAPGTVSSTPAQPPAMPQLDPKVHNAELPPPQPPTGFNDQPPPRMYPEKYLPRHHERAPRNAQWPLNIEISLVEICTFCPSWFMIPEAVGRAIRNGWSREALTKAELLAEDPVLDSETFKTRHGRIQKQISQGAKMLNGVPESTRHHSNTFARRHGIQNDLTANSWRFKYSYEKHKHEWLGDVPLSMMYDKVVQWPTGNDRMIMTQCLEFARDNPERQLDTSHWDWIIASQNLTAPPPLANGQHRDAEALERINQIPDPV